jgi:hypothetical protein
VKVTQSETLPNRPGRERGADSPSERAPARARLSVTVGNGKDLAVAAQAALRRWWVWTSRPPSLAATWRLSAVHPDRVPNGDGLALTVWRLSNATDRLAMFALVLVAPTVLQGPLRWLLARPSRRWGFYLITAGMFAGLTVVA